MSSIWDKWKDTKIIYPKRKHLKLEKLDKIPYYNEDNEIINHKKFEREEQYVSNDYINPDINVLVIVIDLLIYYCSIPSIPAISSNPQSYHLSILDG